MKGDLKIRLAECQDAKFFFDLRNDPLTRAMSRNTQEISWSDHKKWYLDRINISDCELFMVSQNSLEVGTIRVDTQENVSELSWMIAPQQRGIGLGKAMLKQFIKYRPDQYLAVVRNDNIASRRMCEAAGFKHHKTEFDFIHYLNDTETRIN